MTSDAREHRLLRMWLRREPGATPEEQDSLTLVAGKGVVGDHAFERMRHVTIVFAEDWKRAADEVGKNVDPVGRRANLLVSGRDGARFVGRTIRIGGATIAVKGITAPCPVMEKAAVGMKEALKPEGRSGVWGRVIVGSVIRAGDEIGVQEQEEEGPAKV